MKRYVLVYLLAMLLGFSSLAGATLFGMGDGTIYDNDTQLTWLKDGNIFGTYKYRTHIDIWVDTLDFAGFDNWRIPDWSEMGHLYFRELGARFWEDQAKPFVNLLEPQYYYFTGVWDELPYMDSSFFSSYLYDSGRQDPSSNISDWPLLGFAWAVRPGYCDVGTVRHFRQPVPDAWGGPHRSVKLEENQEKLTR